MLLLGGFVQQRAFFYLLLPTKTLETRRPLGCYGFYTSVTWWHWENVSGGIIWNVSHESHLAEDHLGNCHWSLGWKPRVLTSDISCCTACRSQMRDLPGRQLPADLPHGPLCVSRKDTAEGAAPVVTAVRPSRAPGDTNMVWPATRVTSSPMRTLRQQDHDHMVRKRESWNGLWRACVLSHLITLNRRDLE